MELHFPEVITYIGLCRSADTGSSDAETAYWRSVDINWLMFARSNTKILQWRFRMSTRIGVLMAIESR